MEELVGSQPPGTISRRDFLKLGALAAVDTLLTTARGPVVREVNNFAVETGKGLVVDGLRHIAQQNIKIPEDWPGKKDKLLEPNPDYRSPIAILDEAVYKLKGAGVRPFFDEPKDQITLGDELNVALPVFERVFDTLLKGRTSKDLQNINLSYISGQFNQKISESSVGALSLSTCFRDDISPGISRNSGLVQKAIMRTGIVATDSMSGRDYNTSTVSGFVDSILSDVTQIVNSLKAKQRVIGGKKLSMSDLIYETTWRDGGNIGQGLVDAMMVMRMMARRDIIISDNNDDVILSKGDTILDFSKHTNNERMDKNIKFLSGLFKDEFSLVAPITELGKVYDGHPDYFGWIDVSSFEENSMQENLDNINRGGSWYHGLNTMLHYMFLRPEIEYGVIVSYYNLPDYISSYIEQKRNGEFSGNFLDFNMEKNQYLQAHGPVKMLSDFAVTVYGKEIYNKLRSLHK